MSVVATIIEGMEGTAPTAARPRLRPYRELPARPWFFAPPPRVVSDPGAEALTMYTIQAREAYETLVRDGVLVGDSVLGRPEFQEAYSWMLRETNLRLPGGPSGGLLWLWPTATRPRLRDDVKHARGEVLLTVRVERARVLLSEFLDWHAVLNRSLHVPALPGESDEEWEARWNLLDDDFTARAAPYRALPIDEWPGDLRTEMESSWEAIFDPATWRTPPVLQATMRDLRADDVIRAVRIGDGADTSSGGYTSCTSGRSRGAIRDVPDV